MVVFFRMIAKLELDDAFPWVASGKRELAQRRQPRCVVVVAAAAEQATALVIRLDPEEPTT